MGGQSRSLHCISTCRSTGPMHTTLFWTILVVHTLTDNTSMMYSVNKPWGACPRMLCHGAISLCQSCIKESITLIADHLPRVQNHLADHLGRNFSLSHEWSLKTIILQVIFTAWGMPTVSLLQGATGKVICSAHDRASVRCFPFQLAFSSCVCFPPRS